MSKIKYSYILQLKYNGKWKDIYTYLSIDKARAVRKAFLSDKSSASYPEDSRILTQMIVE